MKINNYKSNINNNKDSSKFREEEKKTKIVKKYISKKEDISGFLSMNNSKILNYENIKTNISMLNNEKSIKNILKKKEKNVFLLEFENSKMYNFENFEYIKLGNEYNMIGKGAYSEVFLAKNKINEKYYAIKKIKKYKKDLKNISNNKVPTEILIHRRLIHENIVRAYSHNEDENFYYLIIDYINNGNLYHKIIKSGNGLTESQAYLYFKQILNALEFLHDNNLVHRDLKPENILITNKDKIKLCDFGCCVDTKNGFRETFCGTFEYMAPEIIKELPYNQGVDIWSLGILLYEMLHGHSPFCGKSSDNDFDKNNQRDLSQIFRNILMNNMNFKNNVSDSCKDLIKRLLSAKNEERIKINEIKNHEWFRYHKNLEKLKIERTSEDSKVNIGEKLIFIDDEIDDNITIKRDMFSRKQNNKRNSELFLHEKISMNSPSNLEEFKLENFHSKNNSKIDDLEKQNKLKLLKENIQSKKNLIEKNVDLAVTLPKLDMKTNDNVQITIEDPESLEEHFSQENIKLDHLSSLNRILSKKKENSNKDKNVNQFESKENEIFNLLSDQNEKEKYSNDKVNLNNNILTNYDSVNKTNAQEELFEKVLDNIKYKKKKKPTKKSSAADELNNDESIIEYNLDQNNKQKNKNTLLNENSITSDNSKSISNERNSENLNLDLRKFSTDNAKAGLSTNINSERNSYNINILNKQHNINSSNNNNKKNSFKDILKGVNEDSNIIKNNYYTNLKTEACDEINKFNILDDLDEAFSNNGEENDKYLKSYKRDSNIFNIITKKEKNIKKNNSSSLIANLLNNNLSKNNKNNNYGKICIYDNAKVDESSQMKNKIIISKKEEIQKNIEKEKLKNAKIFNLNFEQKDCNFDLTHSTNENLNCFINNNLNSYEKIKLERNLQKNNYHFKSLNSDEINKMRKNPNMNRVNSISNHSVCFNNGINNLNFGKDSKEIENKNIIKNKDEKKLLDLNDSYEDFDKKSDYTYNDEIIYSNYDEYGTNRKNQERTLAILKNAKQKKETLLLNNPIINDNNEDNFWDKLGNFFGIFKCNTQK